MLWKSLLFCYALSFSTTAWAIEPEEFNPFDPEAEKQLQAFDAIYESQTGLPAFPAGQQESLTAATEGCYQSTCAIFVDIDKATQTLRLYLDGRYVDQWLVSTGTEGYRTPNFNKRFNGRIYEGYTSSRYPGGDYNGLGNMPYAMFISGGFALHGTPRANWKRLGRPASHGCIRIHPDNAAYLNRILRQVGVRNSWITVR